MRKALYILGQLDDLDVEWMIQFGRRAVIPAGTVLIEQGKPVESLYLLLKGHMRVTDERLGSKELNRLAGGDMVGEISFLDANPPAATVTAIDECVVLTMARTTLARKLANDTAFAARFYRALALFLSDRVRGVIRTLGYGEIDTIDEDELQADELDLNLLDNIHLAGQRFERIVERVLEA